MGVTGLWRLVEPAGRPVPVETLENKVLAVDISIWLHQMVKGYQDAKGAPLPNAHLMGLFQRLCKLLYFRIKPIFVFDGAFPELKKETIAKRQDSKAKYNSESERLKRELALLLSKKTAVSSLLGKQISPKKSSQDTNNDDIFKLPALPQQDEESESEESDEDSSGSIIDLHSVDIQSDSFKNLPIKEKYNLLLDLKETRKMNSWGKLHELPKKSDNFSNFQMERLLKRRKVQECLEETEKEMGDAGMSLNELEALLNEEGIDTKLETLPTRRIASDNTTRILMINNVQQALENARKRQEAKENKDDPKDITQGQETEKTKRDELEEDLQKAIKMSLEANSDANTSVYSAKTDESWTSTMTDSDYSDSEDDDGFVASDMASGKAYIMQYSDLTNKAIRDIVTRNKNKENKSKKSNVDKIIEDLNNEKSVIVDNVELSSSEDELIGDDMLETTGAVKDPEKISSDEICDNLVSSVLEDTQASVVFVEKSETDIISLDNSVEDDIQMNEPVPGVSKLMNEEEDSSTSGEFEDVSDGESEFKKPVVQLTLKVGDDPGEDDIFADVFKDIKVTAHNLKADALLSINLESNKVLNIVEERVNKNFESNPKDSSEKHNPKPSTSGVKLNVSSLKEIDATNKSISNATNIGTFDEDDELQKAIQMSLECVTEDIPSSLPVKITSQEPITTDQRNAVEEIHYEEQKATKTSLNSVNKDKNIPSSQPETGKVIQKEPITTEQLNAMVEDIHNEEQDILQEKGRLDRIGRNITEQMTKEAKELLQIFGVPYIVAPTEAEAQCAFLESVKLTDGTITDDSDIWLFGGRTVYKNFFNQKKHVLQFLADRIERSFNLTREQLVLLALLVGSDYTTGVAGVGPVTALEILASFPFNKKMFLNENSRQERYSQIVAGLQEFKRWVKAGRRTDNLTLKKKLKNVDLSEEFPSIRVVQAYLEPKIEKSEESFTWGEIDLTVLRDYTRAKFGWSQNKLDEIIKPVLKRLLDRKIQRSVQDYFKRKVEFIPLEEHMLSKRVKAAVQKMGPDGSDIEEPATVDDKQKPARKRKANNKTKSKLQPSEGPSTSKYKKSEEIDILTKQGVTVLSQVEDGKSTIEINIPKTDRFQEIIPQREKDKQSLLQNKMKAIELFRKTKLDKRKKPTKRRVNKPRDNADLSENSDTD